MGEIEFARPLGVRWTIGDVSMEGFEALRLSVWGAWHVFGETAQYAICCNSVPVAEAIRRTGSLPEATRWIDASECLPHWLRSSLDGGMAEGVGWKLAPLRLFPECLELALDNDCILWAMPEAIGQALTRVDARCVIAEDVCSHFGQFADFCGERPCNSGIRVMPPEFDLEHAIRTILAQRPCTLRSETDEQGLQVAALRTVGPPLVVRTDEVTICSPFPPHTREVGSCGAHFVGLNAHRLPWKFYGRPASEVRREHWRAQRAALYERVPCM